MWVDNGFHVSLRTHYRTRRRTYEGDSSLLKREKKTEVPREIRSCTLCFYLFHYFDFHHSTKMVNYLYWSKDSRKKKGKSFQVYE